MADIADIAELFIPQIDTNEISAKFLIPSLKFCKKCDDDIPEKRQALGGVELCIDCQEFEERKKM